MTETDRTTWVERADLMALLPTILAPAEVVLDIGCGIQPQTFCVPSVHICCEPFAPYRDRLMAETRARSDRAWLVLQGDWQTATDVIPAGGVDTVFLLDVIEHLPRAEGEGLLARTIPLARRQVVVFTPLGFMPQCHPDGIDAWGMTGGAWQEHRSGWSPSDFPGWDVLACRDFHLIDNMGRLLPEPFGAFFAVHSNPGSGIA